MALIDDEPKVIPIPNWRKNKQIIRMLSSHLFKEADVKSISLKVYTPGHSTTRTKYAEIVYMLGDKLYRTEFKLRDDRHWDERRRDGKRYGESNVSREGSKNNRPYFTSSDLLGETGVSETIQRD